MSWLEQPKGGVNGPNERREIKGLGVTGEHSEQFVIAPLDDKSVCVWDIGASGDPKRVSDGKIKACSRRGIISTDNWDSDRIGAVSVDKFHNKAYFAVAENLYEVDLRTLQQTSMENYHSIITAFSDFTYPTPLTVGTTSSLHVHDPRQPANGRSSEQIFGDRLDMTTSPTVSHDQNDFWKTSNGERSCQSATLCHPGTLSILNLPSSPEAIDPTSGMIFVAGHYPSILAYDRRTFPKLANVIHSGARLSNLASIPHPLFYSRSGSITPSAGAQTLIACGDYKGKGSLELYPVQNCKGTLTCSTKGAHKNRVSASRSRLLSVNPHGTRLVFSDCEGGLKWAERDGRTVVRRWNINSYAAPVSTTADPPFQFDMFETSTIGSDRNEVARKVVNVGDPINGNGELAIWTGERIGILAFRPKPRFDWERDEEKTEEESQEDLYRRRMRRALERQADEVKFVAGLGFKF
ncbi:MAG: hypothetical protein LQ351_000971 [Letrouitia transgressa]|nr:MAG: hypothetical protein LQ351_000971 [Letrouitia transgressa]